jgi:hypothetical protein
MYFQSPAQSTLQADLPSQAVQRSKQINYLHVVSKMNKRMEPHLHFSMFFSRHLSLLLRKLRLMLSIPKAKYALTENCQKFVLLPNGALGLEFTQQFLYLSCEKKERNNTMCVMLQGHWV